MADVAPDAAALERLARWPYAVLLLLCLLAWLPGFFTLPPMDRDESRFAQASKQMIESGDPIDIRYSTGSRYNKPVGIYWLQSAATKIAGTPPYNRIWTYRLPSLLGGLLAVFFVYWCGLAFASPPTALLGAGLMAVALLLNVETRIATTDAVLLATIVAAQSVLMRFYLAARGRRAPVGIWLALAGWAAVGIGILIKGPVIAAVLALTIVPLSFWDRDWKWLRATRPLAGIVLVLLIVLPWMIAIALASHGAFYQQSLGHDFAAKVMGGQESHGAPPGYYLALVSLTLWPATLFLLPAIRFGVRNRALPAVRFLMVWAGANWIVFEAIPTKLPHYILPIYPALVLLGALWAAAPVDDSKWARRFRYIAVLQFLVALAALAAAAIVLPQKFGDGGTTWLAIGAVVGAAAGVAAVVMFLRRAAIAAAAFAMASAIVLFATLAAGTAPHLEQIWLSPRADDVIAGAKQPGDPPVVLAGYVEPSLVFLLGTDTLIDNGETAATAAASRGGLVLVEDHERASFLRRLAQLKGTPRQVGELSGLDYSRGKQEHLTLYRVSRSAK
ncbi:MAG TPA: glycosyltransferase family 39 protein [Rhizomicrobium sp.]|jgi:4-amino-4-deoxy-L-arabinose transferase-like glycosyltransferase